MDGRIIAVHGVADETRYLAGSVICCAFIPNNSLAQNCVIPAFAGMTNGLFGFICSSSDFNWQSLSEQVEPYDSVNMAECASASCPAIQ